MQPGHPPICDYEGSDYQQSFWERGERAYEDQVEAVALKRLLPPAGRLLLEVGAGAGRNTPRYAGFDRVALVDYSLTQLGQAQARLGASARYLYVAADAYRLPFIPGRFDAATMIRTLHHMSDAPASLRQVRQALGPGGIFILEFANKKNLKAVLRYALRRQDWSPFSREPVEFASLNFDFHPAAIRSWLEEAGFAIERQFTVSHFRFDPLKRLVPLRLLVAMDAAAQPTGGLWQLTPSVFVRARAAGGLAADTTAAPGPDTPAGLFRCASCGHFPLEERSQALACPACGRVWEVREGIYDFRE